jgi:hypothetical protein
MTIELDYSPRTARRLMTALVVFELFLAAVYLAEGAAGPARHPFHRLIRQLFNLDGEANITAWFSAMQLFAIGLSCLVIAAARNFQAPPSRLFLFAVGLIFMALSADEAGTIHEGLSKALRVIDWVPRFRNQQGLWLPLYGLIGLAGAALLIRPALVFWRHHRREALTAIIGLGLAVLGLAGLEIFGYEFLEEAGDPMPYRIEVAIEELCEMVGMSLVLHSVLLFGQRKLAPGGARIVPSLLSPAPAPAAPVLAGVVQSFPTDGK